MPRRLWEDKKNLEYPLQNSAFRNGGKDYPNLLAAILSTKTITNTPLQLLHQVGTRKTCHIGSQSFKSQLLKSNLDTYEYHMNTKWIPDQMSFHDSQFWKPSVSGYVAAKVTLVDSVTWGLWQAPCDPFLFPFEYHFQSRERERENGHLILQSRFEVHFCFGFSVFFGRLGHFWEILRVLCSVCPPRKANGAWRCELLTFRSSS